MYLFPPNTVSPPVATVSDRDQQPPYDRRKSHSCLREAARNGAERKARVLSKHRQVLARWTSATTRGTPRRQSPRQHVKGNGDTALASSAVSSDGPPSSTTAVAVQVEELRTQSDLVSPLLSLVSTERLGRHVVAAEAIPPGTMLLRETPFAWSLHPEFSGEFCAHCLCEVRGQQAAGIAACTGSWRSTRNKRQIASSVHILSPSLHRGHIKGAIFPTRSIHAPTTVLTLADSLTPLTRSQVLRFSARSVGWWNTAAKRARRPPSERGTAASA